MPKTKLGDVAKESKLTLRGSQHDMPVVGLEHLGSGDLTLRAWDEGENHTFTKVFRKGQMLFGRRRAYLKKAAVAPFDGICSGDITVIEAVPDKILPELLPFIIQNDSFFDFAIAKSAGSLSPRAKWEHLRQFEFTLPPLAEQKKLETILWAAQAALEAYKKLISVTDDLIKSQFIEMFGDPVIDDRGWGIRLFKEYLTSVRYGTSTPPPYCETGLAFIRATNIKRGRVVDEEMKFISEEEGCKIEKCRLNGGEIIIVRSGVNTGDSCVVPMKYAGHFAGYDIVIEVDKERINAVFLNELLNTSYQALVIKPLTARSAQPHLNAEQVKSLPIIQAPLALQNRFADFVEQADKSKFELQRTLSELEATYKALLRKKLG